MSRVSQYHFGHIVSANTWMDNAMQLFDRILNSPTPSFETDTYVFYGSNWTEYAHLMGREGDILPMLEKGGFTWIGADEVMDRAVKTSTLYRPR